MQFKLEQALEILSATPDTVKSLIGDLSDEWTRSTGNRDDWSPFDVVGHLIHCEETDWIPRAELILSDRPNKTFAPFDRYAQFEKSNGSTLSERLEMFAERRRANLEKMQSWNLTPEQLNSKGVHPEFGEVTLAELLSTWVVHDLTHLRQIAQFLAKKYASAVGPWKAYLSILK